MSSTPSAPWAPRSPLDDDAMPIPQILFSFRGRVPRKVFWLYGVLGPMLVSVMLEMLLGIAGVPQRGIDLAPNLVLLWPCLAVAAKRWHDRDKSAWWVLLGLVPVVGWAWVLVENGLLRGSVGENRFGGDLTNEF